MQIRKNLYILRGSQLRREYTQVQIRKNQVQTLRQENVQVQIRKNLSILRCSQLREEYVQMKIKNQNMLRCKSEIRICSGANQKSEYAQVQPIETGVYSGANKKNTENHYTIDALA